MESQPEINLRDLLPESWNEKTEDIKDNLRSWTLALNTKGNIIYSGNINGHINIININDNSIA